MINAIYGKKIGMTQVFEGDVVVPVTVIVAEPNAVCQVKTTATDGYEAVQLGFGSIKENKVNKPMAGHFAKQGAEPVRYLREVRVADASEYTVGDKVTVEDFESFQQTPSFQQAMAMGFGKAAIIQMIVHKKALADLLSKSEINLV